MAHASGRFLELSSRSAGWRPGELRWIQKATERAAALGLSGRLQYEVAVAEQLPFIEGDDYGAIVTVVGYGDLFRWLINCTPGSPERRKHALMIARAVGIQGPNVPNG